MTRIFFAMHGFLVRMRTHTALVLALVSGLTVAGIAQTPAPDKTADQTQSAEAPATNTPQDLKPGTLTQEQIRDLIRRVADKDLENEKRSHDYTYIQRQEEHKLDGGGGVKSTETKTYEVLMLYGEEVDKLIAKNDQPLSSKDAEKEDEKIQKIIDKRKNESEEDRR